jgi:hypothetical protein
MPFKADELLCLIPIRGGIEAVEFVEVLRECLIEDGLVEWVEAVERERQERDRRERVCIRRSRERYRQIVARVACSTCGAAVGRHCRQPNGKLRRDGRPRLMSCRPHPERGRMFDQFSALSR